MYKFKNRQARDFILGQRTKKLLRNSWRMISSHIKIAVDRISTPSKVPDENRPRFGLLRTREFIMKDAYSFSADCFGFKAYHDMKPLIRPVFDRIGLSYRAISWGCRAMGGSDSKEFPAPAAAGEDIASL